jgi:hypothetical protein
MCALQSFGVSAGPQRKMLCAEPFAQRGGARRCRVVSIGSENMWAFEESLFERTSCEVDVFDCTSDGAARNSTPGSIARQWAVPERLRERVRLHRLCLGAPHYATWGTQTGREGVVSWPVLVRMIGLDGRAPDLLKIECATYQSNTRAVHVLMRLCEDTECSYLCASSCEGCEVELFRSLLSSNEQWLLPDQIALELHSPYDPRYRVIRPSAWQRRYQWVHDAWPVDRMLRELHQRAGYSVVAHLPGDAWANFCCVEVLLARTHCQFRYAGDPRVSVLSERPEPPCRTLQSIVCDAESGPLPVRRLGHR